MRRHLTTGTGERDGRLLWGLVALSVGVVASLVIVVALGLSLSPKSIVEPPLLVLRTVVGLLAHLACIAVAFAVGVSLARLRVGRGKPMLVGLALFVFFCGVDFLVNVVALWASLHGAQVFSLVAVAATGVYAATVAVRFVWHVLSSSHADRVEHEPESLDAIDKLINLLESD